jgi:hypothetical protein
MLIIYLAAIFILAGIAFLALSTKTETKKVPANTKLSELNQNPNKINTQTKTQKPGRDQSRKQASYSVSEHVYFQENPKPTERIVVKPQQEEQIDRPKEDTIKQNTSILDDLSIQDEPDNNETDVIEAVLFEDTEGIIQFGEGPDSISPNSFDRLKRLGSGTLEIRDDSLTLRADKLYRFDFHRLKKIRGDKKAVLIYPDTMSHPLLVFSPVETDLAKNIIESYEAYRNG